MTRVAGTCSADEITLSVNHLSEHEDEMVWDTLGHEFAHWIQFNHRYLFTFTRRKRMSHNASFYSLCRKLGVKDERCHRMVLENVVRRTTKVHQVHCNCQTHNVTKAMYTKIVTRSSHRCRACKASLTAGAFKRAA